MTSIALSAKAAKLMKLCDAAGFNCLADLLTASMSDSVCPAVCTTEGRDYTTKMEPDQTEGYCEACGGNTVVSALVLAGIISSKDGTRSGRSVSAPAPVHVGFSHPSGKPSEDALLQEFVCIRVDDPVPNAHQRGPNAGTGTSWWHSSHVTESDLTPFARIAPERHVGMEEESGVKSRTWAAKYADCARTPLPEAQIAIL